MYSLIENLLSINCVPGTEDTAVKKIVTGLCPGEADILDKKEDI